MIMKNHRPPRIVISGGPCSGKTTLFREILGRYTDVLGMPELATIMVRDIGVLRTDDPLIYRGPLWKMQRAMESSFFRAAQSVRDVHALILDSASVCNAAFLNGGVSEMEAMFRTTLAEEYRRYDYVIWLSPPPRSVFLRKSRGNSARVESYEQAWNIGMDACRAWLHHPHFTAVVCDPDNWQSKSDFAWDILEPILRKA